MVNLKVYNTDNTQQVINMSDSVLQDNKRKNLSDDDLKTKIASIAQSIGGRRYLKHKVIIQ